MSFFPILNAPYCNGQTVLYNFPPNNWEVGSYSNQYLYLTFIKDEVWQSILLDTLPYKSFKKIKSKDVKDYVPEGALSLLSLSSNKLPGASEKLPFFNYNHTFIPESRATLSLISNFSKTSYQGELNPFPSEASLLTFSNFLQFGKDIENFLLLLNLEKFPHQRECKLNLYESNKNTLMSTHKVFSNNINIIPLDNLGFNENTLPLAVCKNMSAIPLYFSTYKKGRLLSLEHTHPPGSLVVHGDRFGAQKKIKTEWFSRI